MPRWAQESLRNKMYDVGGTKVGHKKRPTLKISNLGGTCILPLRLDPAGRPALAANADGGSLAGAGLAPPAAAPLGSRKLDTLAATSIPCCCCCCCSCSACNDGGCVWPCNASPDAWIWLPDCITGRGCVNCGSRVSGAIGCSGLMTAGSGNPPGCMRPPPGEPPWACRCRGTPLGEPPGTPASNCCCGCAGACICGSGGFCTDGGACIGGGCSAAKFPGKCGCCVCACAAPAAVVGCASEDMCAEATGIGCGGGGCNAAERMTGSGASPESGREGRLTGGSSMAGLGRLSGRTGVTATGRTTTCAISGIHLRRL